MITVVIRRETGVQMIFLFFSGIPRLTLTCHENNYWYPSVEGNSVSRILWDDLIGMPRIQLHFLNCSEIHLWLSKLLMKWAGSDLGSSHYKGQARCQEGNMLRETLFRAQPWSMSKVAVCHPHHLCPLPQVRYLLGKASFKISLFMLVLTLPNNTALLKRQHEHQKDL